MYKLIFIIVSFLQAEYGAGYAGSSFRYGSNAREVALGSALVAEPNIGFSSFSNPASLSLAKSIQFGFSYQDMSLDRSIQSFSFVKNLPPKAGIALSFLRSGTDNIQGKNSRNENTDILSSEEIQGLISFGVSFSSKFSMGLNIKTNFYNLIDEYNGSGISGDIGFMYILNDQFVIASKVSDILGSYIWNIDLDGESRQYEEKFPSILALGFAYHVLNDIKIFFQEDIIKAPEQSVNYRLRIGTEIVLYNEIKLRLGVKQKRGLVKNSETIDWFNFKPLIGFEFPIKVWDNQFIYCAYALDPGAVNEGQSHIFSFSLDY